MLKTEFEQKESYRWVEAVKKLEIDVSPATRVVHIFDREGDISEVFHHVAQLAHTGVLIRATHDRRLEKSTRRL